MYMNEQYNVNMPWSDEAVHREWTTNSTALSNHCVNTSHQYSPAAGQETQVDKSRLCAYVYRNWYTRVTYIRTVHETNKHRCLASAIKVLWLIYQRPKSKTTCKSRAHVSGIFQFSFKRMRTFKPAHRTRIEGTCRYGCTWWQTQQAIDIGTHRINHFA